MCGMFISGIRRNVYRHLVVWWRSQHFHLERINGRGEDIHLEKYPYTCGPQLK